MKFSWSYHLFFKCGQNMCPIHSQRVAGENLVEKHVFNLHKLELECLINPVGRQTEKICFDLVKMSQHF